MSFQTFVTGRLAALTQALNAISINANTIDELPPETYLSQFYFLIHILF